MDAHYVSTKATYVRPRHYRERLLMEMEAAVGQRFAPLLALCAHHGQPNTKVRHDACDNLQLSLHNHTMKRAAVSCSVQASAWAVYAAPASCFEEG
jgi:hypothetical protein